MHQFFCDVSIFTIRFYFIIPAADPSLSFRSYTVTIVQRNTLKFLFLFFNSTSCRIIQLAYKKSYRPSYEEQVHRVKNSLSVFPSGIVALRSAVAGLASLVFDDKTLVSRPRNFFHRWFIKDEQGRYVCEPIKNSFDNHRERACCGARWTRCSIRSRWNHAAPLNRASSWTRFNRNAGVF